MRHALLLGVAATALALAGCSSSDGESGGSGGLTVAHLRDLAGAVQATSTTCPLTLDVAGALSSAGLEPPSITPGTVDATVSSSTTPSTDPVGAQQSAGVDALDAVAGVYVSCDYEVGGDALRVFVTGSLSDVQPAVSMLVPTLQSEAKLSASELQTVLGDLTGPGSTIVVGGGTATLSDLAVAGPGSAALLVSSGAFGPDDLRSIATALGGDVTSS